MFKLLKNLYNALFHADAEVTDINQKKATIKQAKYLLHDPNSGFSRWAFGNKRYSGNPLEKMQAWNALHSDLIIFKEEDKIGESCEIMCKFWLEHCEHEIGGCL